MLLECIFELELLQDTKSRTWCDLAMFIVLGLVHLPGWFLEYQPSTSGEHKHTLATCISDLQNT